MKNDQKDLSIELKSQAIATKSPRQRVKPTDTSSKTKFNIINIIFWYFYALIPQYRYIQKTTKEQPCRLGLSLRRHSSPNSPKHFSIKGESMDIEFHYYLTGIIADYAGFKKTEVETIAYASQFVDNNETSLKVEDKNSGEVFTNYITQTINILKAKKELMRIYPIYHFIPGDPTDPRANRKDGKMHHLNCTPDNEFANSFLNEACKAPLDTRFYRIGIATHSFVDTWAHQNFVGWYDNFNAIGANALPNIGHADGKHHPDWVGNLWNDERLVEDQVQNNHRFLSAAKALFEIYRDYHVKENTHGDDPVPKWEPLEKILIELCGRSWGGDSNRNKKTRLDDYKDHIQKNGNWNTNYGRNDWLDSAVKTDVRGLRDVDGMLPNVTIFKDKYSWRTDKAKEEEPWYKFQTAVKDHESFALSIMSPHFKKRMGVELGKS